MSKQVSADDVLHLADIVYSIGIGASLILAEDRSIEAALKRADQALYAAKQQGRSRMVLAGAAS